MSFHTPRLLSALRRCSGWCLVWEIGW